MIKIRFLSNLSRNFTSFMNIQNLYSVLFETAAEGLVVVNSKGIIIKTNLRSEELFGYDSQELIGQPISILIPQNYREGHSAHHEGYMKNPHKRSMGKGMELFGCKKDGSNFPVEISLNYFETDGEKFAMALVTDITDRKLANQKITDLNQKLEARVEERTKELETINQSLQDEIQDRKLVEEKLKESQYLYSMIARNFPNGTINVFDKELKYVFVEGKELYKLGITSGNLIGTKFTSRLDPSIATEIEDQLKSVFKGESKTIELEYRNSHYVLFAVPLKSEGKNIDKILVVETNISNQKKAQQDMESALDKEKQLNELKSRFVSMASHEFRTPLSTILTSVTLIEKYQKESDEEKRKKHIYRIKSSVNNLTGILNDFLSLDKLEEGKIQVSKKTQSISEIGKELAEEMQAVAKLDQKINYVHESSSDEFLIDKQILRNVLINLLSNAIKYSEENTTIDFISKIENGNLKFVIRDYGMGIPESDQQHLFDRFFRASNAINIQGTGLGLNIIKKYLDMLDGEIHFESKENVGTSFYITIKK
jgi:PAS domain S-box-containing protein